MVYSGIKPSHQLSTLWRGGTGAGNTYLMARDEMRLLSNISRLILLIAGLLFSSTPWVQASATQSSVQLTSSTNEIDLWPLATMLIDKTGNLTLAEVQQRQTQFTSVKSEPYANLGVRSGAVWLRVLIKPTLDADKAWILSWGYTLLGHADIHLLQDGKEIQRARVGYEAGDTRPARHLPTRLMVQPGATHELLLRVSSEGSLIVPISLVRPNVFQAENLGAHTLQGIFFGIGMCLVIYAMTQTIILRRGLYAAYTATVFFMTFFLLSLQGLGSEYLWGNWDWMNKNASHLSVFLTIGAHLWFVHDTLDIRTIAPRLSILMRVLRATALVLAALTFVDILTFTGSHLAATTLGQISVLATIPAFWIVAKQGKQVVWFVLAGWLAYCIGALILTNTITGKMDYNPWVWDFFQICVLVELLSWFVVLGVDARDQYRAAIRLRSERNTMQVLAETDALTGLPNRRALLERLGRSLTTAQAQTPSAVFMMDLDGFKAVNDTHGHKAGDALLKAVAERLTHTLRGRDFVGRLGGDEFVVVTESLAHIDDAQRLANKLIEKFYEPFNTSEGILSVGLTIGFAIAPNDGTNAGDLLHAADQALYAGKQAGKGRAVRATLEQARISAMPHPVL